jgi:hypothetical protein
MPADPGLWYPAPGDDGLDCACAAGREARAERKTPPRAGLKYWDERTQRVVEPVPRRQCPTAPEVPTFP